MEHIRIRSRRPCLACLRQSMGIPRRAASMLELDITVMIAT